ncbi:hypothetical protein AtNW77_Chr1g0072271 [Arabidopsis thaliana]|uniref:Secreted protein n=4 Tax=Arabidopsis TaxID=3701 RepID=A0A654ET37_ARATH|nr:uncharacterized protein AT1G70949 [Arabidopsis thaliana]KAG7651290.1 hypothetical protein ISN45_At01g061720 [Arabidopsis thaliana x Arabidopsis arenosa]KAG7659152.1 hypothetical protein ISN44_As01g060660 [Arabidopsis suecica]AEE35142.1 hypothetical protein AT1G70949 [Arabidopsis thaliana]CAA0328678.1 unnamed protein product [Arabidopsis thaliana]VYS50662.1 unnamed protein product [Arabidopsis thaliana]|eukprot:NP_001117581.1 hypothetical protein AT1G70949 [Arabidopsis thaliana]
MSCAFFLLLFLSFSCQRMLTFSVISPPVYLGVYQRSRFFAIKFRRRFTVLTADVDRYPESGRVMPRHNNGLRLTQQYYNKIQLRNFS